MQVNERIEPSAIVFTEQDPVPMRKIRLVRNVQKFALLIFANGIARTWAFLRQKQSGDKSPLEMQFRGRTLWLRPGTPDLNVANLCFGGEFDVLRGLVPHGSSTLIIDAGGYIGTAALALSEMFPKSKVVTIEPADGNFHCLALNVAVNKSIQPIHGALVAKTPSGHLRLIDRKAGEWGYVVAQGEASPGDVAACLRPVTIADILQITNCDRVFILKMDIEGGEVDFLRDSAAWIDKVDHYLVEIHPDIVPDLSDLYLTATLHRTMIETGTEKLLSVSKSRQSPEPASGAFPLGPR